MTESAFFLNMLLLTSDGLQVSFSFSLPKERSNIHCMTWHEIKVRVAECTQLSLLMH